MADKKISALPTATTPLAGTEVLPIVQGGVTDQVSVANLTAGRAVSMSGLGVGVAAPASGINATVNAGGLPSSTVANTNFWLVGADANSSTILYDAFNSVSLIARRANGSLASPTAIASNTLFTIGARGYGATGYSSGNRAQIGMVATETWTDTAQGAQLTFATTANGGTTLSTRMTIDNAGNVGIGAAPISALSVAGTTAFTWAASGTSTALVTVGTQGTSGSSLFVNTPSLSASFASGLGIDGTYTNPGGVGTSVVNLRAVGVKSGGGYDSAMAFHTSAGLTSTEQMRISSAGNVTVNTGNLVVGTAGKGIDFSANTHAAGMTSELLDWYEEGTWTGTLTAATPPTTPITKTGRYTRIGNQITVAIEFDNVDTSGASGAMEVTGLPFAATAAGYGPTMKSGIGTQVITAAVYGGLSKVTFSDSGTMNNTTIVAAAGVYLRFSVTYFV